jgi:hypothetical protein
MVNLDALHEALKNIKDGTTPILYKDEDGELLCAPLTDILVARMTRACKKIKKEIDNG